MTLLDFYNLLLTADMPVAHYETDLEAYPYMIYQEFGTAYKWASGLTVREDTKVEIAHFTKTEFDPSLERLKCVLLKSKIGFTIETLFNPENKVILNILTVIISREMEVEP